MRSRLGASTIAVIFAALLAPAAAQAEPQVLGLVATKEPAPLQCAYGVCRAFLGAFCLEERRQPPMKRSRYLPADGTRITLIAHRRDGSTARYDGGDWLKFLSHTAYTSVLATIDERRLAELDAVRLEVEVGPLAALRPEPVADDADPHDAAELGLATGAYRQAARFHFESGDWRGQVSRKTASMVNALPPVGAVSAERRRAVFADAVTADGSLQTPARRELDAIGSRCEETIARSQRMTLRQCLEFEHSVLQTEINGRFWNSLGGV